MIQYPIKKVVTKSISQKGNLGMNLENDINLSNEFYAITKRAVIHKKPTPVQVVSVDYPSRSTCRITEAYYKTPSTTDYNGIYKGKYIDFDCKETTSKTSFPLKNIHPHQMKHLQDIIDCGGIGFFIVAWKQYNEYYLLPYEVAKDFWDHMEDRKSIPYSVFQERAFIIKEGYQPRLDYLSILDEKYL